MKSLGEQLVTDPLLAVAFGPEGIPLPCPHFQARMLIGRRETRSLSFCREVFWQGSAPFGSDHSPTRPTSSSRSLAAKAPTLTGLEVSSPTVSLLASLRADHALGHLFHGDALRQVPGLIHVAVSEDCDVIGQELERHRKQDRRHLYPTMPHMEKKDPPMSALCLFRNVLCCPYLVLTVHYKCVFS